jgi:hypothetical protein
VPEDLFRPQLGEPHHYAYAVDDIEATVGRLVDQLGAGPFFLVEEVPFESTLSRGEPAKFVHNSAFGYCGGGPIELMEILDVAPARVERGFPVRVRRSTMSRTPCRPRRLGVCGARSTSEGCRST